MPKSVFLIDGFNVYHSILRLKRDTGYNTKWLDISALCKSYLPLLGKGFVLEAIYFFSAIPNYLSSINPGKINRHWLYLTCLQSTGIQIELGRFKDKDTYCPNCRTMFIKHEEKETDVAIGVTLFEVFHKSLCDTVVIVSGDTDLSPAVRKCQVLFPDKEIVFAFPYRRKNKELLSLAPRSFSINQKQYLRYQFPNPVTLAGGKKIHKPSSW